MGDEQKTKTKKERFRDKPSESCHTSCWGGRGDYSLLLGELLDRVVVDADGATSDLLGCISLLEAVEIVHCLTLLAGFELAEPGGLLPLLLDLLLLKSTEEGGTVAGVRDGDSEVGHGHATDGKDMTGDIDTLDEGTVGVDDVEDNNKLAGEVTEGDNCDTADLDGVGLHVYKISKIKKKKKKKALNKQSY